MLGLGLFVDGARDGRGFRLLLIDFLAPLLFVCSLLLLAGLGLGGRLRLAESWEIARGELVHGSWHRPNRVWGASCSSRLILRVWLSGSLIAPFASRGGLVHIISIFVVIPSLLESFATGWLACSPLAGRRSSLWHGHLRSPCGRSLGQRVRHTLQVSLARADTDAL